MISSSSHVDSIGERIPKPVRYRRHDRVTEAETVPVHGPFEVGLIRISQDAARSLMAPFASTLDAMEASTVLFDKEDRERRCSEL